MPKLPFVSSDVLLGKCLSPISLMLDWSSDRPYISLASSAVRSPSRARLNCSQTQSLMSVCMFSSVRL